MSDQREIRTTTLEGWWGTTIITEFPDRVEVMVEPKEGTRPTQEWLIRDDPKNPRHRVILRRPPVKPAEGVANK